MSKYRVGQTVFYKCYESQITDVEMYLDTISTDMKYVYKLQGWNPWFSEDVLLLSEDKTPTGPLKQEPQPKFHVGDDVLVPYFNERTCKITRVLKVLEGNSGSSEFMYTLGSSYNLYEEYELKEKPEFKVGDKIVVEGTVTEIRENPYDDHTICMKTGSGGYTFRFSKNEVRLASQSSS